MYILTYLPTYLNQALISIDVNRPDQTREVEVKEKGSKKERERERESEGEKRHHR